MQEIDRRSFLKLAGALGAMAVFGGTLFAKGTLFTKTREAADEASGTFPGIRWFPVMGVYAGAGQGWINDPALLDQQYADYVLSRENAYLNLGDSSHRYWFAGGRKFSWKDVLVDETLPPVSRTQAQNPGWSNYKWNQNDYITEMLNASSRVAEGKAKMAIFVATTATSLQHAVPAWMMNDPNNLTWTDGQGMDHVRLDKLMAARHMADFLIALVKKYGRDWRICSICLGEYYTNPDGGGLPADLDYDTYCTNMRDVVWTEVLAACPLDANGNRVAFIQSQPITTGATGDIVTADDIHNLGLGISGSDLFLFNYGPVDQVRLQLYGRVPLTHQANTGNLGDPVTWDGTPNPWGFAKGQVVPLRYEHAVWYFSNKGSVPLDSFMMRDASAYLSQWREAYGQFGPNGTKAIYWGQLPNYPV